MVNCCLMAVSGVGHIYQLKGKTRLQFKKGFEESYSSLNKLE